MSRCNIIEWMAIVGFKKPLLWLYVPVQNLIKNVFPPFFFSFAEIL